MYHCNFNMTMTAVEGCGDVADDVPARARVQRESGLRNFQGTCPSSNASQPIEKRKSKNFVRFFKVKDLFRDLFYQAVFYDAISNSGWS